MSVPRWHMKYFTATSVFMKRELKIEVIFKNIQDLANLAISSVFMERVCIKSVHIIYLFKLMLDNCR